MHIVGAEIFVVVKKFLERYADDAIVHCKTLKETEEVRKSLERRMEEVKLELHPEKTQIAYCKDKDRLHD